jgi:hypothetical protein
MYDVWERKVESMEVSDVQHRLCLSCKFTSQPVDEEVVITKAVFDAFGSLVITCCLASTCKDKCVCV